MHLKSNKYNLSFLLPLNSHLSTHILCFVCLSQGALSALDDFSDRSDDGFVLAGLQEPPKPVAPSFKTLNSDIDLFGLGFEDTTPKSKDSSEDQEGKLISVLFFFYSKVLRYAILKPPTIGLHSSKVKKHFNFLIIYIAHRLF